MGRTRYHLPRMAPANPPGRWDETDPVLVDMDGTLLDLAFDNFFWRELVPARYAERNGLAFDAAQREITSRYERVAGTLAWYCLEHWSAELELDLVALKRSHRHLIGYLPGATGFLSWVRRSGRPLRIVTNAHPKTMTEKTEHTGVHGNGDAIECAHELGAPKESAAFWTALQRKMPFDPRRTNLVEDSLAVLAAARTFGIGHPIAVARPDSRQPPREIAGFVSVERVADLI